MRESGEKDTDYQDIIADCQDIIWEFRENHNYIHGLYFSILGDTTGVYKCAPMTEK